MFTPRGGHISLAIKIPSDEEVLFEVEDSGIGIPEDEQEKVFDRFYQVVKEGSTPGGTGIGLTIAKDFVEILDGRIELESEIGRGSLFRVILPLQRKHKAVIKEKSYVKEIVTADAIRQVQESAIQTLGDSSSVPVVMIVDESRDMYDYIQGSIGSMYGIIWAPNAGSALEILSKQIPTMIISEIQLPDIDGITFCKKIRKDVKTSRIPFIFLTVKTDTAYQLEAIDAGVDVFLAKPVDIEVMVANINNLISRQERTEAFINRRLLLNAQQIEVNSSEDKLLKEVVEHIHQHMTNSRITADQISYAIGISHSNLYRKIKSITGHTLNEFIRLVRLRKAEQLLAHGKLTVSEVMFQVGFTNHSYFSKCFKKEFGKNPREWRNNSL
jgi:AraC-like DNA-binding protein